MVFMALITVHPPIDAKVTLKIEHTNKNLTALLMRIDVVIFMVKTFEIGEKSRE
jgi:hypothetical protein